MAGSAFHVKVDGLRELRADLKRVDATLPRELNQRLKKSAEPVRALASSKAPKRTGRLAGSIKVRTRGSRVYLSSSLPYAKVVHFGMRHPLFGMKTSWYSNPARPFLRDAVAAKAGDIQRDVADTVEDLMRSAGFH